MNFKQKLVIPEAVTLCPTKIHVIITVTVLLLTAAVQNVAGQNRCSNPNSRNGYCVSIYECPSLLEVIQIPALTTSQRGFIQTSRCYNGFGREPFVCCTPDKDYSRATRPITTQTPPTRVIPTSASTPSNGKANILPVPPNCGAVSLGDRIYNGNDTALDQYAWMVLLEYANKRSLNCGGSLINQRYVLTAAHCVRGEIETEVGPLASIRLGEYDISKDIDCVGNDCNDRVLEVGFEEIIPHPQYTPTNRNRHNDIALIRLNTDVTYTNYIKPVCLPFANTRAAINTGEHLTVSGWGRTLLSRMSNVKQHLEIPVNNFDSCSSTFSTRNINLIQSQLCAGGEFSRDSCDGDSGGPLMRLQNVWVLEGIVSFGNRCGLEGWPGVYTRVADYVDWIQQTLRP